MASFGETVLRVRPTWFVMENVPRARNSRVFGTLRRRFKRAGYGVTEVILDASRCGAPQRRRRFICVGRLGAGDQFLAGALIGGLAPKPMTLRDRFGASLGRHLYFHPRNYDRRAGFPIDEPAPTIRGVRRNVAPGYRRHRLDSADPSEARAPTLDELGLIQTFPPNWIWRGRRTAIAPTAIAKMIGNAVPPALANYVGCAILDYERALTTSAALAARVREQAGRLGPGCVPEISFSQFLPSYFNVLDGLGGGSQLGADSRAAPCGTSPRRPEAPASKGLSRPDTPTVQGQVDHPSATVRRGPALSQAVRQFPAAIGFWRFRSAVSGRPAATGQPCAPQVSAGMAPWPLPWRTYEPIDGWVGEPAGLLGRSMSPGKCERAAIAWRERAP